jgi:hypothetical protein
MNFFYILNPTSLGRCTCQIICNLLGDLVAEIFIRLPPYPCCVLTISTALKDCKQMGSIAFRNPTLQHNSGMPLLGFFTNSSEDRRFITEHNLDSAMLQKLSMFLDNRHGPKILVRIYIMACRIGRVLLYCSRSLEQIYVWDQSGIFRNA